MAVKKYPDRPCRLKPGGLRVPTVGGPASDARAADLPRRCTYTTPTTGTAGRCASAHAFLRCSRRCSRSPSSAAVHKRSAVGSSA
jgi:hypothetical protein